MFLNFNNIILADEALLKQAESGNAEAQFKVAAMYASGKLGNKSEKDKKIMFDWLEKSANQGYLKAQEILCRQYYDRNEFDKALKWTNIALKNNSKVAKSILAGFLMNGNGGLIPVNKTKAIALAKECPDEVISKTIFCELYSRGWFDIEPDLEKAMTIAEELSQKHYYLADLYKSAINRLKPDVNVHDMILDHIQSFNKAMEMNKYSYEVKGSFVNFASSLISIYGDLKDRIKEIADELIKADKAVGYYCRYIYELSVSQNSKIAEKYLLKAADMNWPDSYFEAYKAYLRRNSDEDLNKAKEIAEKALKCQDPDCMSDFIVFFNTIEKNKELREVVGQAYIEGFNSIKNIKLAADNGSEKMMYLYSKLTTDNSEKEKYLIGSANLRYPYACGELAYKYLKTNPEKAYKIIKSRRVNNYDSPMNYLVEGICALEGKGCEKDVALGLEKLGEAVYDGIENKQQILKILYESYCNISDEEFFKYLKCYPMDEVKEIRESNIYLWGKQYMEYASNEEKIKFESNNFSPRAKKIAERKLERRIRSSGVFNSPDERNQLNEFGKVFSDVSQDAINTYVNKDSYPYLFELQGKKNVSAAQTDVPDECYDNIKKLSSAVSMYNMDHVDLMETLDVNRLKRDRYLRGDLNETETGCSYFIEKTDGKYIVNCSKHGSLK